MSSGDTDLVSIVPSRIPTRNEMVAKLWAEVEKGETTPNDKAKLCRAIANLMGYNRAPDYSDLEEKIRQLESEPIDRPPPPWWAQQKQLEQ